jgi:hypothetical protein
MRELDYLAQNLLAFGLLQVEVTAFLVLIYNYKQVNADIESQLSYLGNPRYIGAYSFLSEDIEILTLDDWK